MNFERERKDRKIVRTSSIATIIGTVIAAITLLFGSGLVLPFLTNTPSAGAESNVSINFPSNGAESNIGTEFPLNNTKSDLGAIVSTDSSRIHIVKAKLLEDGYFYKWDETPEGYSFIDMEKLVLVGSVTYTKALTEEEKNDWGHWGSLINSNGESCYEDETRFWATHEAFAVDLPENIEPDVYTYILYHYVCDQIYTAEIQFEIF